MFAKWKYICIFDERDESKEFPEISRFGVSIGFYKGIFSLIGFPKWTEPNRENLIERSRCPSSRSTDHRRGLGGSWEGGRRSVNFKHESAQVYIPWSGGLSIFRAGVSHYSLRSEAQHQWRRDVWHWFAAMWSTWSLDWSGERGDVNPFGIPYQK